MYLPIELAGHALSEFERGLAGLTDDEARRRLGKADGSEMNAIAWTVAHIAGHWLSRPLNLKRYAPGSDDPTPPSLREALDLLSGATTFTKSWLADVEPDVLAARPDGLGGESIGTGVLRATLHTWFHAGEINAVRQQLGHAEIEFVGDMLGQLEWRPSADGALGGYLPAEVARFTIAEFERGLEGMAEEDMRRRMDKADGSQMNAVTWTLGHIAGHWLFTSTIATGEARPSGLRRFGAGGDPTPPPLSEMRELLDEAKRRSAWVEGADDALLSSGRGVGRDVDENVGTRLLRVVLHTWFHTGEINAIRQLLGHPAIAYVGPLLGRLEWRGDGGA